MIHAVLFMSVHECVCVCGEGMHTRMNTRERERE